MGAVFGSSDLAIVRDRIGYLPAERGLYKKQKVVETLAYFGQPKGLDVPSALEIQDLLLAEKARGRTLLLFTHQMSPVGCLCDRLRLEPFPVEFLFLWKFPP